MPQRVLIIGILFCLAGVLAVWNVIEALFRFHMNLNFAVFLLPVGIGLLKGKRRSRWWARFWIIIGYFLCVALVVFGMLAPDHLHAKILNKTIRGAEALPYMFLAAAFMLSGLYMMHRLLYSRRIDYFFQE